MPHEGAGCLTHSSSRFRPCLSCCAQVKALELSEEQVHVLLAMRRLYFENMGALERRREELAAMVVPVRLCPAYSPEIRHNRVDSPRQFL